MQATKSQGQPPGLYTPDQIPPLVFENFSGGLNTNSTRPGIKDEECWWLDGFMYVGPNYIRTLPGIGPSIFAAPPGGTIVFFDFFNIGTTPYALVCLSDGGLWAVNTNTNSATPIAPAGTISSPARANMGVSQWGSKYLLLIAKQTNGYFIWDGTNLFQAGTLGPVVTIDSDGLDYTSPPTITPFGGAGHGATFSSTIIDNSIQTISVTNPGIGYTGQDVVGLAFSGGGSAYSTCIPVVSISGGSVSSVSISVAGNGYTTAATVDFLGGGGFGAQGTVVVSGGSGMSGGSVTGISITVGGQGYISPPTAFVEDSNNPVAVAAVSTMPFGLQGTSIETYNSQVWITNGAQVTFSAPESTSDFATSDGAGSFTSNDSFLRVGFTQVRQSNGFLYLIADSSINYISGVQTNGAPPITTFTNQNADPEIGTPYPATVDVFSRNILFANAFGAHVSYGGAVTKISDNLDGVYNTVPNFGGTQLSAGKAIIFGKKVWILLVPVIDTVTGQQVNKLFMWNGKQWWSSQQDVPLIYIQHQEIASVLTCYGTDGLNLYPLFNTPSVNFTKTVQSKLWARPQGYNFYKSADRLWGMVQYYSSASPNLTVNIDNENGSEQIPFDLGLNAVTPVNNSDQTIVLVNNSNQPITLVSSNNGIIAFEPQAISQNGVLLGLTLQTEAADIALISMMIAPQITDYRG